MLATDALLGLQVGQGSRHFQHAVGGAQRQREAFAGVFQPLAIGIGQMAMGAQPGQVEKGVGGALALELDIPRCRNAAGSRLAGFAVIRRGIELGALAGHGNVQVDAVEQGPGELAAVTLDLIGATAAAPAGVAEKPARAGVHGRHQLEAGRETDLVAGPGDHDVAAFQGLAKHFQHAAVELGQLVQKQNAMMGQGDFSWLRATAAPHQRRAGCAVVGMPEWPLWPVM